jgi:putative resolvase
MFYSIIGAMKYLPAKQASEILGYHMDTLRRMADAGKIEVIRTKGGHRRYNVEAFIEGKPEPALATVCYCRVSSAKQKDDLERQVAFMRSIYPEAEIIRDIGSGLNFKRKGLRSLLDRLSQGDKLSLVVAHRDRLARFGFEVFRYMVESNGGELVVLDNTVHSPFSELTADLLSILHVFSCRMHGLRRYRNQIKEDPNLSESRAEGNS